MTAHRGLLTTLLAVIVLGVAWALPAPEETSLRVGHEGLSLYPRWNKAFAPIATVGDGAVLVVLRDRGPWKQVEIAAIAAVDAPSAALGTRGWVYCDVAAPDEEDERELRLPIAASPTTSGLVVKGWTAAAQARSVGADLGVVEELVQRPLDVERFMVFLEEGPGGPAEEVVAVAALGGSETAGDPEQAVAEDDDPFDELETVDEDDPFAQLAAPADEDEPGADAPDEPFAQPVIAGDDLIASLEGMQDSMAGRVAMRAGISDLFSAADEVELGKVVAARILAATPVVEDPELAEYVSLLGLSLADHGPIGTPTCVFAVLDSEEINACSTPGGFIFVTRGAVQLCDNEAELAALLAHEIAHVTLRHAMLSLDESRDRLAALDAFAELDDLLPEPDDPALGRLVEELSAIGDELHARTRSPFDQELEREADRQALRLLVAAGYEPSAAVDLMIRALEARTEMPRMASHPPPGERAEDMTTWIDDHGLAHTGSLHAERFDRSVQGLR